jgi:hypothetical protein
MQQFGDLTGEVPPSLSEADTAMRDATKQLGEGNDQGAGASEQKAIEALQKGGREMGQAKAKQFGPQQDRRAASRKETPTGRWVSAFRTGSTTARVGAGGRVPGAGAAGARSARPPLWAGQLGRR